MTISNTTVKQSYVGDGANKTFAIPFDFNDNIEIKVYVRDTSVTPPTQALKTIVTDYTLSGDPPTNVVFGTAPTSDDIVMIIRSNPLTQPTDYIPSGEFPADAHEVQLDEIVRLVQELNEKLGRAPVLPVTSQHVDPLVLPEAEASKLLGWNSAADAIEYFQNQLTIAGSTKGDIAVHDGAEYQRLAVGSNGQVLASDSGETLGVKWASAAGLERFADDAAFVTENGAATEGDSYANTTLNSIRYYTGSGWVTIADLSSAQTLTNKTIAAGSNTISGLTHGSEVDNPSSGVHGAVGDVVGTTDAETLTNKTMTAAGNTFSGFAHGSEVDNPSSGVHGAAGDVVGTTDAQTLTNKIIDGDENTIQDINRNTQIKAEGGQPDYVVVNTGLGALSGEPQLILSRGGTGFGTYAAGDIIIASALNTLAKLAKGADGQVLTLAAGLPSWAASAGGGAGAIAAHGEWNDDGGGAPIKSDEFGYKTFLFGAGLSQTLTIDLRIGAAYSPGDQINMKLVHYSPSAANTILLETTTTLIRAGTDAVDSTTNQHASGNSALTNNLANEYQEVVLPLCDGSGLVNGVAVAVGSLLRIELVRGTDTDTADIRFVPGPMEVL